MNKWRMRNLFMGIITAICLLFPTGVWAESTSYIVSFDEDANVTAAFEKKYNLTPLTEEDHGLYTTDKKNAVRLESNPKVENITPNGRCYLAATANDPYYTNGSQWAIDAIQASYGWNVSSGTKPVRIAVIDTGFAFGHQDNGSIVPGKDYITNGYTAYDHFKHGTACAGLIGAKINNGLGIAGLTNQCEVIVFSVFRNEDGGEEYANDDDIIAAIYDAVDVYNVDVISMSFGGSGVNEEMEKAARYAYEKNTILVAATGNQGANGSPYEYPAMFNEVVGVANMNSSYEINYDSTANDSVYIAAPGTHIATLDTVKDNYNYMSGTSLATPHVAALAGLARCIDPDLTPEGFKYYLRSTSTDMESQGYDIYSGYGLINYKTFLDAVSKNKDKTLIGSGTVANPYQINSAVDLELFSLIASENPSASAQLTADIGVSDHFSGIESNYQGTFDGAGHKISNLQRSLFHVVEKNGSVKNLQLSGNITNDIYNGFVADENNGTLEKIVTQGNIYVESAGGICGINRGTITQCINKATIRGINIGGIAASCYKGTIAQCINTAEIRSETNRAAGICSILVSGGTIKNCYNIGSIQGTNRYGGIVATAKQSTIRNCYYLESTVSDGDSSENIVAKTEAYMKSKGFLCMLNDGGDFFTADAAMKNNGYPIFGTSGLTTHFKDVATNQWYANAIYDLTAEGILNGKGGGIYDPQASVTRAEFVMILAKLAGEDISSFKKDSRFRDIAVDSWYNAAVNWAAEKELAYGKTSTEFYPNDNVTREEIASFLMRYINRYHKEIVPDTSSLVFSDSNRIADWAKKDVASLTALGIIRGYEDHSFRPQKTASRAEAAQLGNATRLKTN